MKNRLLLTNWLLVGLILFHVPFGHMALKGFILCIEADGDLNIENACTQPMAITLSKIEISEATTPENHCGTCVDLPLDLDYKLYLRNNPFKKFLKFNLVDLKVQPPSHLVLKFKTAKHSLNHFESITDPQLQSLSTTILLI